ncbi:MAG: hypothetical protein HN644_02250 [Rhodospirillales bacterium]|jgi:hypothetical protein|nr:hypothetical protein [Rhodospirillales bacterium]MBT4040538.1 hypothetical protein [Rhodospirillales bacterium]MBT4625553.1 hypothetical protein [Rhodospirillales bacterium]MBT5352258.1 hypothetical protein [Rhodospirillales bacterium]MBT5519983.1 hypothetical protein [Rhodospirillales bacterium]
MKIRRKIKKTRAVVLMVGTMSLAGCTGELIAIEGVSAAIFDKTASDHVVSLFSGKDCSFLRVEQDKSYCVEDAKVVKQSHLYCYPTLGATTCYTEPDPQRAPSERIGYIDESDPYQ